MEKGNNQEGVVEEPLKKETSEASQATSTDEKAASAKQIADDKWKRDMQSRTDKAEFALKSTQDKLQELHKEREQQRLEARRKEIADLDGDTDEQAKVRRKHQLEDEVTKLQDQRTTEEGAVQRKYDQAIDLASQYNLSLEDARELMTAGSPKEMELMAQLKVAEQAKGKTSPETTGFPKPDSASSDAAPSDFKQLEKNFIADPYKYGKQYKEALAKRGQ